METNATLYDVKDSAPAQLKLRSGRLAIVKRPEKGSLGMPFQHGPVVRSLYE